MRIAELKNDDYGITALVSQFGASKFSVVIRDDEEGEVLPIAKIYPTLDGAMAYAKKCTA